MQIIVHVVITLHWVENVEGRKNPYASLIELSVMS